MAQFQFRLARVSRVKELLEEQAKNLWVAAHNQVLAEQGYLQELEQKKQSVLTYGYSQMDISIRTAMYQYLQRIDAQLIEQAHTVASAEETEVEARSNWTLAKQENEILAKLEEKEKELFTVEELQKAQNLIDELRNSSPKI